MGSSGVIVDVAAAIDAAAQGPALVIGSGPSITPDLRLLVRASEVLRVDPETNVARRPDEFHIAAFRSFQRIYADTARDFGAVVIDGERSVVEVARDVAQTVWTRLP